MVRVPRRREGRPAVAPLAQARGPGVAGPLGGRRPRNGSAPRNVASFLQRIGRADTNRDRLFPALNETGR
ncbi:hypothetical protein GCM10023224_14300 [Streptomonospora halophila]|uniref:Uncharacterized protein n=1 Tax=Streptomonospora halophila TaxID=427369 RepID=A0ABP9GAJ6_9ACTN